MQDEGVEHSAQLGSARHQPAPSLPWHRGVAARLGHCAAALRARWVQRSLAGLGQLEFLCWVLWLCAVRGQVRLVLCTHKKLALLCKEKRLRGVQALCTGDLAIVAAFVELYCHIEECT